MLCHFAMINDSHFHLQHRHGGDTESLGVQLSLRIGHDRHFAAK